MSTWECAAADVGDGAAGAGAAAVFGAMPTWEYVVTDVVTASGIAAADPCGSPTGSSFVLSAVLSAVGGGHGTGGQMGGVLTGGEGCCGAVACNTWRVRLYDNGSGSVGTCTLAMGSPAIGWSGVAEVVADAVPGS
ncbi:MAG TPA: hypothetical protein VF550_06655, partial [Polyangia bacterium]